MGTICTITHLDGESHSFRTTIFDDEGKHVHTVDTQCIGQGLILIANHFGYDLDVVAKWQHKEISYDVTFHPVEKPLEPEEN